MILASPMILMSKISHVIQNEKNRTLISFFVNLNTKIFWSVTRAKSPLHRNQPLLNILGGSLESP